MRYHELEPGPTTRSFVKCYWILEDDNPAEIVQTIVPDGRSELIINLGSPFQQQIGGRWYSQPEIFFVGQITGPIGIRPHGPCRTIGIRFRPEGAARLFAFPMFELTDAVVPLTDISQPLNGLFDRLREFRSAVAQIAFIEDALCKLATRRDQDRLISAAVIQLERSMIGIRNLSASFGLSARQFERRFRTAVGIPPKLFSRLQRFQHVFQMIEQSGASWVNTAVDCGYYDQAHLIRDFREFSGKTPTLLLPEEFDLTRHFSNGDYETGHKSRRSKALNSDYSVEIK